MRSLRWTSETRRQSRFFDRRNGARSIPFALGLLVAFASGLTSLSCQKKEPDIVEAANAVPVELTRVTERSIRESTLLTGVLNAYREVDIVSEVSGEIVSLHHDVGADIAKGAILASVEKKVLRENLNRAEASLIAAEARYSLAVQDFARDSTLHANGDISQAAYDAGLTAFRSASADLKASRAARELAARDLQEGDISAPFAGVVSRRRCEVGTYVTPGLPLFRLVNIDSLRLVLSVSQTDLARLSVDTEVEISVEGLGDRVFHGNIRSIAPEADEATRTFPVEVVLANPQGHPLRDGLVVHARLYLGQLEGAIAIPREAILKRSGGEFVFVAVDSTAHRRMVRIGPLIDDLYVVEQGLRAGELLVTAGMRNLENGSRIMPETVLHDEAGAQGDTP
jgi:membrane fusion protein (multidrug efflux system)